jgi:hypothetical protein
MLDTFIHIFEAPDISPHGGHEDPIVKIGNIATLATFHRYPMQYLIMDISVVLRDLLITIDDLLEPQSVRQCALPQFEECKYSAHDQLVNMVTFQQIAVLAVDSLHGLEDLIFDGFGEVETVAQQSDGLTCVDQQFLEESILDAIGDILIGDPVNHFNIVLLHP